MGRTELSVPALIEVVANAPDSSNIHLETLHCVNYTKTEDGHGNGDGPHRVTGMDWLGSERGSYEQDARAVFSLTLSKFPVSDYPTHYGGTEFHNDDFGRFRLRAISRVKFVLCRRQLFVGNGCDEINYITATPPPPLARFDDK